MTQGLTDLTVMYIVIPESRIWAMSPRLDLYYQDHETSIVLDGKLIGELVGSHGHGSDSSPI